MRIVFFAVLMLVAATTGLAGCDGKREETTNETTNETTKELSQAVKCGDWSASAISDMRGGNTRLVVLGTCEVPESGYAIELKKHEPQGFNPHDLLLDLVVRRPSEESESAAPVSKRVLYSEQTNFRYDTVTIRQESSVLKAMPVHIMQS